MAEIGKPLREITFEPLEDPVPACPDEDEQRTPAPDVEPERAPA